MAERRPRGWVDADEEVKGGGGRWQGRALQDKVGYTVRAQEGSEGRRAGDATRRAESAQPGRGLGSCPTAPRSQPNPTQNTWPKARAHQTPLTRDHQAQMEMSALPEGGTCHSQANGYRKGSRQRRAYASLTTSMT